MSHSYFIDQKLKMGSFNGTLDIFSWKSVAITTALIINVLWMYVIVKTVVLQLEMKRKIRTYICVWYFTTSFHSRWIYVFFIFFLSIFTIPWIRPFAISFVYILYIKYMICFIQHTMNDCFFKQNIDFCLHSNTS